MEFNIDILTILGIGMAFSGALLVSFFTISKRFRNDGYFWLYAIMLLLVLELVFKTFIHSRFFLQYPFFYMPGRFFNLTIYPVFLLFIWSITQFYPFPKKWRWLLLLPFLIYVAYVFIWWVSMTKAIKLEALQQFYLDGRPGPFNYWNNASTLIKTLLIPLSFIIPIGYYFFKFTSIPENPKNKRLVSFLTIAVTSYFAYTISSNFIYKISFRLTGYSMIEWPIDIIFLSMILGIFCVLSLLVNTGTSLFPEVRYSGSPLKVENYDLILSQLKEVIETKSLYLDKGLSIKKVAVKMDTNSKYISQVINDSLKMSFTDFLNAYRIEEAKKQIQNPNNSVLTLEAIGNLSGFQSKSTFFTAFKKITGMTPSQYQKSLPNESKFTN